MTRRNEILSAVTQVASLPVAAMKVIPMLRDPSADICEVARLINHDPGLAANVLKLANSAGYAARSKVTTIDAALVRLGMRRTMGLVIGSAVAPFEQKPVRGYDLPAGALWRHGVAVAIGTQVLDEMLELHAPEHSFTAGLLVDIGKYVLGHFLEVDGTAIRNKAFNENMPFELAEQSVLGIDHAEVGAALLQHWGLPDELVEVVRWHHRPNQAREEVRLTTDLVHAADQLCTLSGLGVGWDGCNYLPCEAALQRLDLTETRNELALCSIVERLKDADDVFEQPTAEV